MEQFARRHVKRTGMFSSQVIALALIALLAVLWAFAQPATVHATNLTASGLDGAGAVQVGTQGDYE